MSKELNVGKLAEQFDQLAEIIRRGTGLTESFAEFAASVMSQEPMRGAHEPLDPREARAPYCACEGADDCPDRMVCQGPQVGETRCVPSPSYPYPKPYPIY